MMFSVIIPVYNVKEYLDECIESVLSQTYKNYEIILVDDGSNDGSELICDRYSNQYNNIHVCHKENGGQSSARNVGVGLARGEYFVFVDSDDYIASNTLEMFDEKIIRHGEIDVILSERMFNVEPNGEVRDLQRRLSCSEFEGINGREAIVKMGMEWSPCGKCFRTQYWRNNGFYFIEGRVSEDFQLIDRVTLEADKVAMVRPHYYYRWKIQSSTMHGDYGKLVMDTIYVLEDWNDYIIQKGFDNDLETIIRKTLADMFEHTVMGNAFFAGKELRREIIEGIKNNTDILKHDRSIVGRLISLSCSIIGVRNTCYLLGMIKSSRKKRL